MAGLTSSTRKLLNQVLLSCGPFGSDQALRAIFTHSSINAWRNSVQEATSRQERVALLIDTLYDRRNDRGENVLVLFLQVLLEDALPGDGCRQQLERVRGLVEQEVGGVPAGHDTHLPARTPSTSSSFGSDLEYERGLNNMRNRLGPQHGSYADMLLYEQRLRENLKEKKRYRDTEGRRAGRAEIIDHLNEIALSTLGVSFNELCR
jgi:hypothetical protein